MTTLIGELMQAVRIVTHAGSGVLRSCIVPIPEPAADELLVKVEASGVNRADIILRDLDTKLPLTQRPDIPGLEVCGEVVAVGAQIEQFAPGDRVASLVPAGGGYAEYCCVPAALSFAVPRSFDVLEAAALPEALLTLWNALFRHSDTNCGRSLLVHGGTSGVGSIAIKLARLLGGFETIIATAGSAKKCQAMDFWGADRSINYRDEDFVTAVQEATEDHGVEVILDMVGGDYTKRNIAAAARRGRIVQIGMMSGNLASIDIAQLMAKQVTLRGATIWFQTVAEKSVLAAELRERVWPEVLSGSISPVLDSVFPLALAMNAQERMESGVHVGKILLSPSLEDTRYFH